MYGVTFEGDNLRIVLVRQEKSRRMLPFAFQVTDARARNATIIIILILPMRKCSSGKEKNEATHTYAVKRLIPIIIHTHVK